MGHETFIPAALLALVLSVQSGCGQNDGDKGGADKGAAITAPGAALPSECQELKTSGC